jgi:hypothetical protein
VFVAKTKITSQIERFSHLVACRMPIDMPPNRQIPL